MLTAVLFSGLGEMQFLFLLFPSLLPTYIQLNIFCNCSRFILHVDVKLSTLLQTGVRPVVDPLKEPATLIMNGRVDNRNYRAEGVRQYSMVAHTTIVVTDAEYFWKKNIFFLP